MAQVLISLERKKEARLDCEKALAFANASHGQTKESIGPDFYLRLAYIFSDSKQFAAAKQEYEKAIELSEKAFNQAKKEHMLFSWDWIPGDDNGRLIEFLEQDFDVGWVRDAEIEKINNDTIIRISTEKNSISLILNAEETKISIVINNHEIYEFIAMMENGKLNIYDYDITMFKELKANALNGLAYDLFAQPGINCKKGLEYVEEAIEIMKWLKDLPFEKEEREKKKARIIAYLDTKSWLHYKMGKYDEAKECLEEAMEISILTQEGHYHLALVYERKAEASKYHLERKDNNDKAMAQWKHIYELDAKSTFGIIAGQRLHGKRETKCPI